MRVTQEANPVLALDEIGHVLAYLDESLTAARDIDYSDRALTGASLVFWALREDVDKLRAKLEAPPWPAC